jgi:hypothetical protein
MIATAPLPTSAMRAARLWRGNIFGEHEETRNLCCHAVAVRRLATHRTHRQPIIGKHSRWDNRPRRRVLSCLLLDHGLAHPILRHGWLMARSGRFLANAIAAASLPERIPEHGGRISNGWIGLYTISIFRTGAKRLQRLK